jgi:hypothetical protein
MQQWLGLSFRVREIGMRSCLFLIPEKNAINRCLDDDHGNGKGIRNGSSESTAAWHGVGLAFTIDVRLVEGKCHPGTSCTELHVL